MFLNFTKTWSHLLSISNMMYSILFFFLLYFTYYNSIAQEYKLVWADEFNGTSLDTTKWSYEIGNHHGWGNDEKQYYRAENAVVNNGYLTITANKEKYSGFDYTSARIRTIKKGDWKYGKFEMRAQLPIGQGIWPAFWMMPTKSVYGGWPISGEIDIMEYLGHQTNIVHGTLHYGDRPPNNIYSGKPDTLKNGDFHSEYHNFTLIWEEGKFQWFVDGELYQTQTKWNTVAAPYPAPFNQEFHIILNMAVGGYWPGYPDDTTEFPQEYRVDYIRVYQKFDENKDN